MAGTLREGAYSGGSRMAAPWPGPEGSGEGEPVDDEPVEDDAPADEPVDDEDQADEDQADEDEGDTGGGSSSMRSSGIGQDGAGWVLGLLFWGWVALPFIQGGPSKVKAVLMAKFLNRAADGSDLP